MEANSVSLPGGDRFVECISNQMIFARALHETWRSLVGPSMLPAHADELNEHPRLTKLVESSLVASFVVAICSLFDTGSDAVSLHRLAKFVRCRDGGLPKSLETRLKKLKRRMVGFYNIRNEEFAHKLESKFQRSVFEVEGFSNREVSEVTDEAWLITKELIRIYDGSDLTFDWDTRDDLQKLFPKFDRGATWL